jgi:FkbM family methyltransferase
MIHTTLYRNQNNFKQVKKRFNLANLLSRPFRFCLSVADGQMKLDFYPTFKAELYRYATFFTKEEGTIKWLEDTLQENDIFYDVGANLGLYSLFAAKLNKNIKTYAFEPHKLNFASLINNVRDNGLLKDIIPISIPLSDTAELTNLYYKSLYNGGSMNQLGKKNDAFNNRDFNVSFEEIIYAMPMDALAGTVLPLPTVVKIDVDGNELAILKGMTKVLSADNKPRSVQIEINPGYKASITELMNSYGYILDYCHYTSSADEWAEELSNKDDVPHNAVFKLR